MDNYRADQPDRFSRADTQDAERADESGSTKERDPNSLSVARVCGTQRHTHTWPAIHSSQVESHDASTRSVA